MGPGIIGRTSEFQSQSQYHAGKSQESTDRAESTTSNLTGAAHIYI